jgi:HTH-type transcriptional regulator/antitoxin HigA
MDLYELGPIKTEADYEAALAEVEGLWGADPGTEAGDRLHVLMLLVEDYERHAYDVEAGKPDPIAIIEHIMDSNGYRPKDLGMVIGSRPAATMILKRQPVVARPDSQDQRGLEYFR